MKIALDVRYRTPSGGSLAVDRLLPWLFKLAGSNLELILIKYEHQEFAGLSPDARYLLVPALSPIMELYWVQRHLPRLLRSEGVDLYHGLKLFGPLQHSIPVVHTAGGISKPYKGKFPLSPKVWLYHSLLGSYMYQKSSHVIAVSQYIADFLQYRLGIPANRITVVHNGLDDDFRRLATDKSAIDRSKLPTQEPYILCAGNVVPVKNHITAVRVLDSLATKFPHHLVIAGRYDTPCAQELSKAIKKRGLTDRVHFVGFTPMKELVNLMRCADILLHPSLSEAFGLSVLEAMACGLPIVGSNVGGIPEICNDAGRLLDDPCDDVAIAKAAADVLQDDSARRRMTARGLLRSQAFDWRDAAQRTLAVYAACLDGATSTNEKPG